MATGGDRGGDGDAAGLEAGLARVDPTGATHASGTELPPVDATGATTASSPALDLTTPSGGGVPVGSAAPTSPGGRAVRAVQVGDTLGRYELLELVGEGGMATVYRARDRELRREVAVKVLFPHLARQADLVGRFHREARAAAGLEHANILRVYDVGDDPPHIVMELVRGRSLSAELDATGPLLAEIVACVGALLADALAVAHAAGVIHRDVKPANVMLAAGGGLLLADFGVARVDDDDAVVTRTGALLGTPAYMSPEQAAGETSTARSDLYSLGATLYQLGTGSLPFSGPAAKVMAAIAKGALVPPARRRPQLGGELSRVIERLMARDPAGRPASAVAVAAELRAIASAGGLGDPSEELPAYLGDPAGFVAARTPVILARVIAGAARALDDGQLPRAMSLADRASAIAPEDPAVVALIARVADGGRAGARRQLVRRAALGALGVAALGAGVLAVGRLGVGASAPATPITPTTRDAGGVAATRDAAPSGGPASSDAAARADAAVVDGRRAPPRDGGRLGDGGGHPDAALANAALAPAVPDAAALDASVPPVRDGAATEGRIAIDSDAWCGVEIDGVPRGRFQSRARGLRIPAAAGHHVVTCAQTGLQARWSTEVDVVAGQEVIARGTLLRKVRITIAVRHGDGATIDAGHFPNGTIVDRPPGRYNVAVIRDGQVEQRGYVDLPPVAACTLRDDPNLDCYP